MADAIEKQYLTPLVATLNDFTKPIVTRVNAFRRINEIYDVLEIEGMSDEQLHAKLNDIFNKPPVSHESFNDEENKLFNALQEKPKLYLNLKGGKRSIKRKRSIGRRSIGKRSMKRSQIKSGSRTYSPNGIVATLTEMLHVVKLHHWRTHDYSVHKATDNLHEALSEQVDSFVEKLLGSKHTRSNLTSLRMRSYNTLPALKQRVEYYKRYLRGMPASLGTDLLNIRDELLGSLNQFSYMLSLH
jgi:Family of unknown function (DUF5856)